MKSKGMILSVRGFSDEEASRCSYLQNETWKSCPLLGEHYEVSDLGRIRLIEHDSEWFNGHSICTRRNRSVIRRGTLTVDGYVRVSICRKSYFVHRLVLITFQGESKLSVNHINGLKTDNRLCNLEYVTHQQNMKHALETGLWSGKVRNKTNKLANPQRISNEDASIIKELNRTKKIRQKELAKMYNVHLATISRICRGIGAYSNSKSKL